MRVMIVEDEALMADELRNLLAEQYPGVKVVALCTDGESALREVAALQPDLLFLDIEMPGQNGLQVARKLASFPNPPVIVFVTAFDEFALPAFTVNAADYLLKPLDERDLKRAMRKAENLLQVRQESAAGAPRLNFSKKLSVEKGDRMEIVDLENICLFYAKDRRVFLVTREGEQYRAKFTLQEFEARLPADKFFRCHRNYIVNIDQIKQVATWFKKGYLLILKGTDNWEVPVGRAYVGKLKEYIDL